MNPHNLVNIRDVRRWSLKPAFLALALASFSGCTSVDSNVDTTRGWLSASSPKGLEVDRAQYRHVVYFDTDRDDIRADERDRLIAFLATMQPTSQDSVRLEGHADERANDIYNLDLASRRNDAIKQVLVESGLSQSRVQANAFGEQVPASSGSHEQAWSQNRRVEIVLERYVVTPPPCPDWSRRTGQDYSNQPHSNFGCATETNLGLMIANPRDLVRGRKLGPADGIHQAEGIGRYREGQLTDLQEERVD
ncbi:MAG: CpaD family pilus assembly protein [Geminicoccaceae bacterium]